MTARIERGRLSTGLYIFVLLGCFFKKKQPGHFFDFLTLFGDVASLAFFQQQPNIFRSSTPTMRVEFVPAVANSKTSSSYGHFCRT